MLFKSLIATLAVIIHIQSVAGHPHQLHPFHANKVRMLQWDFRNADHHVRRLVLLGDFLLTLVSHCRVGRRTFYHRISTSKEVSARACEPIGRPPIGQNPCSRSSRCG